MHCKVTIVGAIGSARSPYTTVQKGDGTGTAVPGRQMVAHQKVIWRRQGRSEYQLCSSAWISLQNDRAEQH
jgi:hypothetical protein